ncbi:MAG: DUF4124 domain-containing protein [Deltaproteobacteria bacterium]|nr:DUF4124 domain-containing protein [Deltaproteobacteria bacterium]
MPLGNLDFIDELDRIDEEYGQRIRQEKVIAPSVRENLTKRVMSQPATIYTDAQGRPMDYQTATGALGAGALRREEPVARIGGQRLRGPKRFTENTGPRRVNPQASIEDLRRAMEHAGGGDAELFANEIARRQVAEEEAGLRKRYDETMGRHYEDVAKMRRETPERGPSGYRRPRTPLPAKIGTAAYESGFMRYESDVNKRRDELLKEAENRRLGLRKAEADLKESEAKAKKYEGEAKEAEGKGKYYGEGGKKTEAKPPKMSKIDELEYNRYAKALADMMQDDPNRPALEKKLDDIKAKYQQEVTTEKDRPTEKGPGIVYKWKDKDGTSHFTDDPKQAPEDAEMTIKGRKVLDYVKDLKKRYGMLSKEEQQATVADLKAKLPRMDVAGRHIINAFLKSIETIKPEEKKPEAKSFTEKELETPEAAREAGKKRKQEKEAQRTALKEKKKAQKEKFNQAKEIKAGKQEKTARTNLNRWIAENPDYKMSLADFKKIVTMSVIDPGTKIYKKLLKEYVGTEWPIYFTPTQPGSVVRKAWENR